MSRKSRSRSQSEPVLPDTIRRKSDVETGDDATKSNDELGDQSWSGTLRNLIWNLWNQGGIVEDAAGSSSAMTDSEANLSEYEEEIRKNRPLPEPVDSASESAAPMPIPGERMRRTSSLSTPVVSPRQDAKPFLDHGDYGIVIGDPEEHNPKEFILTDDLISKIHSGLPSRWRIATSWTLLYSTNFHGFSLSTMFTRSKGFNGPVLAVVKDSHNSIFGAFVTEPFHPHIGHFGTGECFLWKVVQPGNRIHRFRSSGLNDYFMMCEPGFIAVGCGDGKFGLWVDSQFESGISQPVPTFNNEALSQSEDFGCVAFELWGLQCEDI